MFIPLGFFNERRKSMNKFLTKIAGVIASFAMVIGVGVGVANKQANSVYAQSYSTSFGYGDKGTTWTLTNTSDQSSYWKVPEETSNDSIAVLLNVFAGKNVTSDITITINSATYGNGSNPTESKFSFYTSDALTTQVAASQSGTLPSSSSYTNVIYTITQANAENFSDNLVMKIAKGAKQIRLKSILVAFSYELDVVNPLITFSDDEIIGEENDEFSFTYEASNLTESITWSPANNATDIIDYEVDAVNKTVSGTLLKAGEVTLTATSGSASDSIDFVISEHQVHRKYTVDNKDTVSGSGDTMTGASASYSQTYSTASQATSGNSMTLSITGLTKKVNISKLVLSMHSNASAGAGSISVKIDGGAESFIAGTSSSVGAGFNSFGDNTSYGSSYRDVTWSGLTYVAKQSIVIKIYCITTNSLYCQSFDIFFTEQDNTDVATAFSVSPNTWSGFDSQTLNVNSFTPSITVNGEPGTSADYTFLGIGYMNNETFVARDANFSSGHPTVADTRLCWKANYPTTVGGSTYLFAYVTLTVSADGVSSIAISGDMEDTDYFTTESWDKTGLVVTAHYASDYDDVVTNSATIKFYSDSAMTEEVATPADLGVGEDQTIYVKATYQNVSNNVAYEQTVTVTVEHGTVENDPLTVAEAVTIGNKLAHNNQTQKQYYIQGVVTQIDENTFGEQSNYATFWLQNGGTSLGFEVYRITRAAGCDNYTDLKVGAEVLIKCQIKRYSSTIETGTNKSLISITYVAPTLTGITLDETEVYLGVGEDITLSVSPTPVGAELGAVTWESSEPSVATVNQEGEVIAVAAGASTITARAGGFEATCVVNVSLKAVMEYAGSTTTNMTDGNNAEIVSLDAALFSVVADKGTNANFPGLNKDGDFRVYNGNTLTVKIASSYTIDTIVIDFLAAESSASIYAGNGSTPVTGNAQHAYSINEQSFKIVSTGTVKINSIEIIYRDATAVEKTNRLDTRNTLSYGSYTDQGDGTFTYTDIAIRFGGLISKTLWDELDTNEHLIQGYGVMISYENLGGSTFESYYNDSKAGKTVEQTVDFLFDNDGLSGDQDDGLIHGKDYYFPLTNEKTHPAEAIDSQKVGEPAGDYYVWNLYKKVSMANIAKDYTAVAYIRVGNELIFLQQTTASAQSLAYDLIDSGAYAADAFDGSLAYMAGL